MNTSSNSQLSANAIAVSNVISILTENGYNIQKSDSDILIINGAKFHVTTNTSKNSHTERHCFSISQIKGIEENENIDSVIIYHDASDSCVMFGNKAQFIEECKTKEGRPYFKTYFKTVLDDEGNETRVKTACVPFFLIDYKELCANYAYFTHQSRSNRMENWMMSGAKKYKKSYIKFH